MRETGKRKRVAFVLQAECVACGCCLKVCPRNAIAVVGGIFAAVDAEKCIGCGKCARECPAAVIAIAEVPHKKRWYDYLWIASSVYFLLGFVNILFAWFGLVCLPCRLLSPLPEAEKHTAIATVGAANCLRCWAVGLAFPGKKIRRNFCAASCSLRSWLPGFFLHNVFPDAVEHVAGV